MRKLITPVPSELRNFVVVPDWARLEAHARPGRLALEGLAWVHPAPTVVLTVQ